MMNLKPMRQLLFLFIAISIISCNINMPKKEKPVTRDTAYDIWAPDSSSVTHCEVHRGDTACYGAARP